VEEEMRLMMLLFVSQYDYAFGIVGLLSSLLAILSLLCEHDGNSVALQKVCQLLLGWRWRLGV
jgi:hypothetical protein